MPRRPRSDEPGLWHHVMNRGLARRTVFENDKDLRKFLALLARAAHAGSIELHAYCILTTHFHLLVRSLDGDLGETMRRVQNVYVRWFNRTRQRDGPLFRGRFTSRPVETLAYRHAVVSYIDFNAVEARIVDRPEDYRHGSASHYARRRGPIWLCRSWIEGAVRESFCEELYRPESYAEVFGNSACEAGRSLVSRRLAISTCRGDPLDDLIDAAPAGVLDWMHRKAALGDGTQVSLPVCDPKILRAVIQRGRSGGDWLLISRGQKIDGWDQVEAGLLRELCGLTLREIGLCTGREQSRVGRVCERHRVRLVEDCDYAAQVAGIASEVLRTAKPNVSSSRSGQPEAGIRQTLT